MNTAQQIELDDARHGTLFFLGKLEIQKEPSFDLGLINNFVGSTSILSDLKNGSTILLQSCSAGKKLVDGLDKFKTKIQEALASFFDAITEKIADIYGDAGEILEWVGEFGTWAISTFAGSLSDIIPGWGYVQDAADIYDGIKTSVIKAVAWIGQIFTGWGVKLLEGGPAIMARSIAQHSASGLAGGLKDIAISSCKIGLQAAGDAAAGIGSVVGAVTGILQRMANLVGYCVQRFFLNRTINQASYQWENKGDMIDNHLIFNEWFNKACVCTPVVAALTLCSGNAANPLRFLKLLTPDNTIVNQSDYDKGIKHIAKLKALSGDYVREYTSGYHLTITSRESYTSGMLRNIFK